MTEKLKNFARKAGPAVVLILVGGAMILGGYFLFAKFVRDRESAMNYTPQKRIFRRPSTTAPQVKTYTAEDLEKARKNGTLPPGMPQPGMVPPTIGIDAVQRSLKTVQEINRINQMNQRLMEQNRRMQNQR